MSLTSVLKIEIGLLDKGEIRGLELAENVWKKAASPTEAGRLVDVLEEIMQRSRAEHIRYPRILLLRKKELERKPAEFKVCAEETPIRGDEGGRIERCPLCGGNGVLINPTGLSSTLCPNGCFLKRRRKFD